MEKRLGKIECVKFGHVGYNEAQLGLQFTFSGGSWGVVYNSDAFWDAELIECTSHCDWSDDDRDEAYAKIMREVSSLLAQAQVHDIYELKGKPVECTFDGNLLKSWRILTEVL